MSRFAANHLPTCGAGRRPPPTRIDDRVYAASDQQLHTVIRELPDHIETVILVGHNPGIDDLARCSPMSRHHAHLRTRGDHFAGALGRPQVGYSCAAGLGQATGTVMTRSRRHAVNSSKTPVIRVSVSASLSAAACRSASRTRFVRARRAGAVTPVGSVRAATAEHCGCDHRGTHRHP